jgi:hypothetical protein
LAPHFLKGAEIQRLAPATRFYTWPSPIRVGGWDFLHQALQS